MKIILSRKGFDSQYGGVPSPILPDGSIVSLPIPSEYPRSTNICYDSVYHNDISLGKIVEDLTNMHYTRKHYAHLDPDLNYSAYERKQGWRPLFGQVGNAQTELKRAGVGGLDLFIFFGWFRETEYIDGKYRYVKYAPNLHVMFGWLQVDYTIPVGRNKEPTWANYHPHFHGDYGANSNNTVYVAKGILELTNLDNRKSGGGIFMKYNHRLRLTMPGHSRSTWCLPGWFHPKGGKPVFSYHSNLDRWTIDGENTILRSVARGQEFILDVKYYPEAVDWISSLVQSQ